MMVVHLINFKLIDFSEIIDEIKEFYGLEIINAVICILNLQGGKIGGIFLHGAPNTGKSLLIKIIAALYEDNEIGILYRCSEDNKFAYQHLIDKEIYIGEEFMANDITGDSLKLLLEGSRLCYAEQRNKGLTRVFRKPVFMTGNYHLATMCPRHDAALRARLFYFTLNKELNANNRFVKFIHRCNDKQLAYIANKMFKCYKVFELLIIKNH